MRLKACISIFFLVVAFFGLWPRGSLMAKTASSLNTGNLIVFLDNSGSMACQKGQAIQKGTAGKYKCQGKPAREGSESKIEKAKREMLRDVRRGLIEDRHYDTVRVLSFNQKRKCKAEILEDNLPTSSSRFVHKSDPIEIDGKGIFGLHHRRRQSELTDASILKLTEELEEAFGEVRGIPDMSSPIGFVIREAGKIMDALEGDSTLLMITDDHGNCGIEACDEVQVFRGNRRLDVWLYDVDRQAKGKVERYFRKCHLSGTDTGSRAILAGFPQESIHISRYKAQASQLPVPTSVAKYVIFARVLYILFALCLIWWNRQIAYRCLERAYGFLNRR